MLLVHCQLGSGANVHGTLSLWESPKVVQLSETDTYEYTVWISGFVCVCRSEGGVSNSFKALGCQEQLDPKDSQVSEDPREYCYGNSYMYPNFYPEPLEALKAACTRM